MCVMPLMACASSSHIVYTVQHIVIGLSSRFQSCLAMCVRYRVYPCGVSPAGTMCSTSGAARYRNGNRSHASRTDLLVSVRIRHANDLVVSIFNVDFAHVLGSDQDVLLAKGRLGAINLWRQPAFLNLDEESETLTSIPAARSRLTPSRKTSHSSMHRNGPPVLSQRANKRLTVENERSPPDNTRADLYWVCFIARAAAASSTPVSAGATVATMPMISSSEA